MNVFESYPNPKNSSFGPQTAKNDPKIHSQTCREHRNQKLFSYMSRSQKWFLTYPNPNHKNIPLRHQNTKKGPKIGKWMMILISGADLVPVNSIRLGPNQGIRWGTCQIGQSLNFLIHFSKTLLRAKSIKRSNLPRSKILIFQTFLTLGGYIHLVFCNDFGILLQV